MICLCIVVAIGLIVLFELVRCVINRTIDDYEKGEMKPVIVDDKKETKNENC